MSLLTGVLDAGMTVTYAADVGRKLWLQIARGSVELADRGLVAGDGVAIQSSGELTVKATEHAEVLLFDMRDDAHSPN